MAGRRRNGPRDIRHNRLPPFVQMDATPPPPAKPAVRVMPVLAGLVFMGLWITAHVVWATMSLMGTVMANDSGTAAPEQHVALIGGVLGGQVVACSAGIPAGLAFFWRGRRKLLIVLFAILFIAGACWQFLAFQSFVSAASNPP